MVKISALPPAGTLADDDETPFVDDSAATTKKFTLTVLKEWLQSLVGWISTAMLADDSVTAAKIDWASTGTNAGIWWEELARGSASGGALTVSSIPARKYLKIIIRTVGTGGTISHRLRFNSDTGTNYASRYELDGAADSSSISETSDIYGTTVNDVGSTAIIEIINEATREKTYVSEFCQNTTAGAANAVNKIIAAGKWTNTTNQISSITLYNTGGGTYATTTEMIILGHN